VSAGIQLADLEEFKEEEDLEPPLESSDLHVQKSDEGEAEGNAGG
jgi:hypothetical protein